MPESGAGIELCRRYYWTAVRPIIERRFPGLAHSAVLLGCGSEVLGYDDGMSRDHDWGPRAQLLLAPSDKLTLGGELASELAARLPTSFEGFPTRASRHADGTRCLVAEWLAGEPWVAIETVEEWCTRELGVDAQRGMSVADWLSVTSQELLGLTAGAVYHDDLGLSALRSNLAWYPHDVWLYLLAAGWARIGEEEHLMGRAGYAGDELGSALIGARLVRDVMRLCFLLERRYAPYAKWLGRAFGELACAGDFNEPLWAALRAETWQAREQALVTAYERLAGLQAASGLCAVSGVMATRFHGRPFSVIHLGTGFSAALLDRIEDPTVRAIAAHRPLGSIDQASDNTALLADKHWRAAWRRLYAVDAASGEAD
mgnify:CR=1 FL=1